MSDRASIPSAHPASPICILGGTFDPVHNAHLAIARAAAARLDPERILWLPTGRPKYREPPVAAPEHRVAMLRLAIAGEPRWAIDERELAPEASGYSVDTLQALRAEHPGRALVMLLGADQLARLDTWREPQRLRSLARFAVFARPGSRVDDPQAEVIAMEPLAVSASEVRRRLGRGEDVAGMLPAPVLEYIRAHGLYR